MFYFIDNTPFPVLITIVLLLAGLCLFAFFDTEKKKPGHPAKYIFLSAIPVFITIIIDRYVYDHTHEERILWVDLLTLFTIAIVYLTTVVTFILAHKKGYTNRKVFEQNKIILILFAIACGIALILLGAKMILN